MRKATDKFQKPSRILAFDGSLKLKAIFHSYNVVEKLTGISRLQIIRAANGESVAANNYYWRELISDDDICDTDDLNKLSLIEFDRMMGQDRLIYATRKMLRGQEILESQYKRRFQILQLRFNRLWRKLK